MIPAIQSSKTQRFNLGDQVFPAWPVRPMQSWPVRPPMQFQDHQRDGNHLHDLLVLTRKRTCFSPSQRARKKSQDRPCACDGTAEVTAIVRTAKSKRRE